MHHVRKCQNIDHNLQISEAAAVAITKSPLRDKGLLAAFLKPPLFNSLSIVVLKSLASIDHV